MNGNVDEACSRLTRRDGVEREHSGVHVLNGDCGLNGEKAVQMPVRHRSHSQLQQPSIPNDNNLFKLPPILHLHPHIGRSQQQRPIFHSQLPRKSKSSESATMAELRRKLVIVGDGACGKTCLLMYVV